MNAAEEVKKNKPSLHRKTPTATLPQLPVPFISNTGIPVDFEPFMTNTMELLFSSTHPHRHRQQSEQYRIQEFNMCVETTGIYHLDHVLVDFVGTKTND